MIPTKVVSWCYNSNLPRQHRDIAFYNVKPDFRKVRQPYKNPTDKRIRELVASGSKGSPLYDWWQIQQVKNVSKDKQKHPCQMPLEVMERIVGILVHDRSFAFARFHQGPDLGCVLEQMFIGRLFVFQTAHQSAAGAADLDRIE